MLLEAVACADMATELPGPIDVFASRLRTIRDKRGLSARQLAEAVTRLGVPWDRSGIAKLETRTRRNVTIEDLFAFSLALNVAPLALLVPDDDAAEVVVAPGESEEGRVTAAGEQLGKWIAGDDLLGEKTTRSVFDFMGASPRWKQVNLFNSLERSATTIKPWRDAEIAKWKDMVADRPDLIEAIDVLRRLSEGQDAQG